MLGANQKNKNYIEGKDVIVTWALGHLLTLKMPEDYNKEWREWSFDTLPMIPKKAGIKPLPKTMGQLKAIQRLTQRKDIKEAVVATDAGREGELVARWILQYVRFNKPVKRLWISSQTTKAIKDGFKKLQPGEKYDNLYESALARSEADWLIGLNVTRALTVKYEDNLSAGRVQTPTLAMVRQQEKQIETFKPQQYYIIEGTVKGLKGKVQIHPPQSLKDFNEAESIVKLLQSAKGKVTKVSEKTKKEGAPLPYDLTEIQREANQRYGYSAKKTLSIVQRLYEIHKTVSYPRTDSKYLTTDMAATMKERVHAVANYFPEESKKILRSGAVVQQKNVFQNAKVTDHHGLIPTEQAPRSEKMDADEHRIYQMIVRRFLGLFHGAYVTKQQKVEVSFGDKKIALIQTQVVNKGWKFLDDEENSSKAVDFKEGERVSAVFEIKKETTSPPSPLNEGSLLAKMEKHNLGTPATRAEIIERLISSELMERQQNRLAVTPKGKQLLQLVNPSLVTPELTEKWENQLEEIAKGKLKRQTFIREIEKDTARLVSEIKRSEQKYTDFSITEKKCPECGERLREKNTRQGKIYVCTNSECNYSRRKDPKISNKRCPQCHRKMEILSGKNGEFFRCKYCVITEKVVTKQNRKKKMTKHEEKRLLKKYSQPQEPEESPLAAALKAAMEGNKK